MVDDWAKSYQHGDSQNHLLAGVVFQEIRFLIDVIHFMIILILRVYVC